jgi:hypothetical protein
MRLLSEAKLAQITEAAQAQGATTNLNEIRKLITNELSTLPAKVGNAAAGHIAESDFPPDFFYDPNFIPASAGAGYGLYPMNYFRANAQAERLSQSNGFYHRVIEMARDHICGEGFEIDVDTSDPDLKEYIPSMKDILQETFFGPENQVDQRYHQWVYEALMSGMLALTAIVRDNDGFVEFGDIPARWIVDVFQNPQNASDILAIKTSPGEWIPQHTIKEYNGKSVSVAGLSRKMFHDGNTYKVVRYERKAWECDEKGEPALDPDTKLPIPNSDFGKLVGEVFLIRMGNLRGQKFGQGDGFHIHDLVTELEQIIFLFRRAYEIQLNLVLWLKYSNIEDDKLDEKAKMVVPTAPLPLITNDSVDVQMLSPELRPADLTELVKTLARFIAGVMGLPEFTMGDGTDTNVATAGEQALVMYQKFVNKRRQFETFFAFMGLYCITQANKRKMLYRTKVVNGENKRDEIGQLSWQALRKFKVNGRLLPFPKTNMKDNADLVKSLADSVIALLGITVEGKQLFDPMMFRDMLLDQLTTLGFSIDRAAMEAKDSVADDLTGSSPTGAKVDLQDVAA